jgi:hypothetical protein
MSTSVNMKMNVNYQSWPSSHLERPHLSSALGEEGGSHIGKQTKGTVPNYVKSES